MTNRTVDPAIERYLGQVRAAMRGVPHSEVDEIVLELRSHIAESVGPSGDVRSALETLGDPMELAHEYRSDGILERGECANAPLAILHGLMLVRLRSRGAGWLVFAIATLGYVWAIVLAAAAGEKLFSPRVVGLWKPPGAMLPRIIVDGAAPAGSRELLGWWFIPAALAAFLVLLLATNSFGRWWIRRSRRDRDGGSERSRLTQPGGPVDST